jgi:hypothetical protein
MLTQSATFKIPPCILTFNDVRLYIFAIALTALNVFLPYLVHQFNLAGSVFLPMHFFALIAGLVFGWRAGLLVGFFSPLVSFSLSGMPVLPILSLITLEITAYGFVAGFLREKVKVNMWIALAGALISGRLIIILAGSFLLVDKSSINYLIYTLKMGWPGILFQFALVPYLSAKVSGWFKE